MKYLLFIPIAFFLFSCEDKYERPLALDCAGVSGGTAEMQTYCLDSDNDGLGGNYCSNICDAFVEEGWVNNSSDSDDSCTSNFFDCSGTCDGDDFSCIDQ